MGSNYSKSLLATVSFSTENDTGAAFVFANSKTHSHTLIKSLEPKLDKMDSKSEVVHVHQSLRKEDKFGLIQLFTGAIDVAGVNSHAMVATSAVDVGMNHKD